MDTRLYLSLLLFAATVLVLWAFGLILAPFAVPIAWAMCFVTVTGGLYRRLASWTKRPRLSALLMTLATAGAVTAPLVVVGSAIAQEASALSRMAMGPEKPATATTTTPPPPGTSAGDPHVRPGGDVPAPPGNVGAGASEGPGRGRTGLTPLRTGAKSAWDRFFDDHPRLASWRDTADRWLEPFGTDVKGLREQALGSVGKPFAASALGVLQGLLMALFGFVMMLATLYFLYRDGERIRALVIDLSPLEPVETRRILGVLHSTAYAGVVGGLAIALIQGILGGVAFAITGVEGPVLWGFVMAVLSLLPIGGAAFVWSPVAVYFLLDGQAGKGWFLVAWGVVVIGLSDNLLRPWLMRRTGAGEVHPLLLFFAVISGIGLFGFSGIVFGPLVVAFVIVVVSIFRDHFGKKRAKGADATT